MGKTILVTGAAGFVGKHLLRMAADAELSRERFRRDNRAPHAWIVSDRVAPTAWWGTPGDMRFVAADLEDLDQVESLIGGTVPSVVIHLAGRPPNSDTTAENCALTFGANLISTCNLLRGLRRFSGKHGDSTQFILASSGQVYGDMPGPFTEAMEASPPHDYGLSKLLAEQSVLAFSRDSTFLPCILRPSVIYGPGQTGDIFVPSLIAALRDGRRFAMTGGMQRRDFLFVEDMASALLLAVRGDLTGTFNVSSGHAVPVYAVGEVAARLFGRPELLGVNDLPYREGEVWNCALDSTRLQRVGWRPQIGLEEGIRRTVEWARQR